MAHLSVARARILNLLIDQPKPCTVNTLSTLTRQHSNTIREHLDGLVDDQLAVRTRTPTQIRGRPAWLYSSTTEFNPAQGSREYAGLAFALAGQIARKSRQPHADAIETGQIWGRELARQSQMSHGSLPDAAMRPSAIVIRRKVVTLLAELGFAPSPDAHLKVIRLHRCPLLEAARQYPEIVCGVHLGIVSGALNEFGADPDQTERSALRPFSEPGACRLELSTPAPTAQ